MFFTYSPTIALSILLLWSPSSVGAFTAFLFLLQLFLPFLPIQRAAAAVIPKFGVLSFSSATILLLVRLLLGPLGYFLDWSHGIIQLQWIILVQVSGFMILVISWMPVYTPNVIVS